MRLVVALVMLAGCGRVNFGYPVVNCDQVIGSDSRLGPDDHCYVRNDFMLEANNASDACMALGGHAVTITSDEENSFVATSLGLTGPTRIGLYTDSDPSMNWLWATSEPAVYEHWAAGYPMYCQSYKETGVINTTGEWTSSCTYDALPVVCEIEPWHVDEATGHGYRISWAYSDWLSANARCAEMGAHLATLTSVAERLVVAEIAGRTMWIGGSTVDGTSFTWIDGTTVTGAPWGYAEPDSGAGSCVALDSKQAFFDANCIEAMPALCERDE
jgi:hypothetical protein